MLKNHCGFLNVYSFDFLGSRSFLTCSHFKLLIKALQLKIVKEKAEIKRKKQLISRLHEEKNTFKKNMKKEGFRKKKEEKQVEMLIETNKRLLKENDELKNERKDMENKIFNRESHFFKVKKKLKNCRKKKLKNRDETIDKSGA